MFMRFIKGFTIASVMAGAATYSCCFVVRPGEAAVLYNKLGGVKDSVYTEGLQFRVLGLDEPKVFDIRLRPRVLQTMTGTKDLQMVNITLRVLFRPKPDSLPTIYRSMGMDYDERLLPSVSNEILKAVVAEYKAEDLIQKRHDVSNRIRTLMEEKVAQFGLIMEDLSLVDIQFGKDFMTAVEQKQVAQQEAERFKFVVMENEQKKLAAVTRAEGEAESAKLISEAFNKFGTGLMELRQIEASRDIATELTKSRNVKFVPSTSNVLLDVGK